MYVYVRICESSAWLRLDETTCQPRAARMSKHVSREREGECGRGSPADGIFDLWPRVTVGSRTWSLFCLN